MIKIAHLYYDLMNLYGENGNVRSLEKHFNDQNQNVEISYLSRGDEIDFTKYDIYYLGMGTEENQLLVLEDIIKYKKEIKEAIKSKLFIVTGNSLELFGMYIKTTNKSKISALKVFDYYTEHLAERIAEELIMETKLIDYPIIGFQNRQGVINNINAPWFDVNKGIGSNLDIKKEGYQINNFYGTYSLGPILIRNPHLTDFFVKKIMIEKGLEYKEKKLGYEYQAYQEYLNNFIIKVK